LFLRSPARLFNKIAHNEREINASFERDEAHATAEISPLASMQLPRSIRAQRARALSLSLSLSLSLFVVSLFCSFFSSITIYGGTMTRERLDM